MARMWWPHILGTLSFLSPGRRKGRSGSRCFMLPGYIPTEFRKSRIAFLNKPTKMWLILHTRAQGRESKAQGRGICSRRCPSACFHLHCHSTSLKTGKCGGGDLVFLPYHSMIIFITRTSRALNPNHPGLQGRIQDLLRSKGAPSTAQHQAALPRSIIKEQALAFYLFHSTEIVSSK